MDRGLAGHTLLAAACVGAAYVAWTRPQLGRAEPGAVVVAAHGDALREVRWEGEGASVRVTRGAPGLHVTTTRLPPADGHDAPETYPGSAQAEQLFASMAPLRAARRLGRLTAAQHAELGLSPAAERLVLTVGEASTALAIGRPTFGTFDVPCLAGDGEAYLLAAKALAPLRHGGVALQDHAAVGLGRDAFDRVDITFAGVTRRLVQRRGSQDDRYLADPADPARRLPRLTAWLERALTLNVTGLLPPATQAPSTPRLQLRLFAEDDEVGTVSLWPATDALPSAGTSRRFGTPVTFYRATAEALAADAGAALADGRDGAAAAPATAP